MKNLFSTTTPVPTAPPRPRPGRWLLLALALLPALAARAQAPCAPAYTTGGTSTAPPAYNVHQQSFTAPCTGRLTTMVFNFPNTADDLRSTGYSVRASLMDAAGTTTLATLAPTDQITPNSTRTFDFSAANVVLTSGAQYRWELRQIQNSTGTTDPNTPVFFLQTFLTDPYPGGQAFATPGPAGSPAPAANRDFRGWTVNLTPAVTTGTISGPLCAGAAVSVPFGFSGTVSVGAGNVYTAQLSNASGSFAAPVAIGTLASTASSGTVSATLPAGTASGTGYRIRVIASNPATPGADNGSNLTIGNTAAPTGAASQSFASGATVANLAATGTAIQWYAASTGGTALASTTALVNGTTYYATQTVSGCESGSRLAVTATVAAPANQAPVIANQNRNVDENTANGTLVGAPLVASDPDAGQTLSYAITAGNAAGKFAINASTGQITVAGALDYETVSSYALTVRVTDNAATPASSSATVTVDVNDVNEAPTALALSNATVAENTGANVLVGTFSTTDPGRAAGNGNSPGTAARGGAFFTYTLVAGTGSTDNALVSIGGAGDDELHIIANPDFETKSSYAVRVRTTDGGGLFFERAFTLTITNVNEAPVIAAQARSIAENSANGTAVGAALTASDVDAGTTLSYSITAGNAAGKFAINASTGQLTVAGALDFETTASYALTVQVSDGALTASATVTVSVTNVNEAPVIAAQTRSVAENSAIGTNVGAALTASDVDAGTTLTYSITGGNTGGAFAINSSTGQITVAGALDFETTPGYALTVQVSDGTLTGAATVTVNLTNVNEAPTLANATRTVAENTANGTAVGTPVTGTDPDAGATLTYAITGGNAAGKFAINSSTGQLTVAGALDFETTNSYALTVQVSDGTLSDNATVTVNVTNVNEAPVITAQTRSIAENSANGTAVGLPLTASDVDAGTTLAYSITAGNGTGGGAFAIGSTGQLTVADVAQLDFETTPVFTLTVRVSDGALTASSPITVNLTDVAEAVDLVVNAANSPFAIPAGLYNNITVAGAGVATLTGAITLNGAFVVQGSLNTNCQPLTGPGSFTLAAGGTLFVCDAGGLYASGNAGAVRVTGNRSYSTDANYVYNGTTTQNTGRDQPAAMRSLTTTNNSQLLLNNDLAVAQTLTLAGSGNLDLATDGANLTLRSSATGTALVVNSGTGVVTGGTATVQRYLTTTNAGRGYRHYSSPVRGNRLSDLGTATFAPVFSAAYNTATTAPLAAGFPTVLGYDQSRMSTTAYAGFNRGWFSPAAADLMGTGTGYAVNLNGTERVDFTGTLNTGDYARTLPRATGAVGGEGLHLVGNPYPAPLDWSLVAPADRSGMDAAFYVFESSSQYGGAYRSAVNGIGSSSFIGSSQGFFVRVTPGQPSGTLTFRNAQRLTDYAQQVAVRRGAADLRPQLHLTLAGNGAAAASDDFYLYAQTGATPGTDAEFDAVKLTNPTGLNLASLTAAGQALAIDGRADFGTAAALRVPLQVAVPAAGSYTLTAAAVANLPLGTTATLVDNLTGTRTALSAGTSYRFATTTTTAPGRFWLNLTPAAAPLANAPAALAAQVLTYPNPTTGRLTVVRPVGAAASAVLLNALGQTVRTLALPTAETALDLRGLATGVYTLRLTLDGQPVSKRVVIE